MLFAGGGGGGCFTAADSAAVHSASHASASALSSRVRLGLFSRFPMGTIPARARTGRARARAAVLSSRSSANPALGMVTGGACAQGKR